MRSPATLTVPLTRLPELVRSPAIRTAVPTQLPVFMRLQTIPPATPYTAVGFAALFNTAREHRKNEEQGATIAQQQKDFDTSIAQQQKQIDRLTATVKEQVAQIQKVSAQLELNKFATGRIRRGGPAPKAVVDNQ